MNRFEEVHEMKAGKTHLLTARLLFILSILVFAGLPAHADDPTQMQVTGGSIQFNAATNVLALSIHGQSNAMTASLTLHRIGSQIQLENVRATVPPQSLTTGLSLRDQHMRKKVFSAEDATMPPLEFVTEKAICPEPAAGQEASCIVAGEMTMRGVRRPFSIALKVSNEGKAYRVKGDSTLMLSAFGIERPCQLGVCVNDEVKLNVEFHAKESAVLRGGGVQ